MASGEVPVLRRGERDCDALLRLVLASICVAVEHGATPSFSDAALDGGNSVPVAAATSPRSTPALPPLDALLHVYLDAMWKQPIEQDMKALNDWSLASSAARNTRFHRDIPYPSTALAVAAQAADSAIEFLSREATAERKTQGVSKSPKRRYRAAARSAGAPELFRLSRIVEDELEARWDHRGNPVQLRRNVLGEPYAPLSDPLRYARQSRDTPPGRIFQQVKRGMRAGAVERERRRIQALNEREAQRKLQLQQEQQQELSPEEALEAKLDRLLLLDSSNNNAPQSELGGGDKANAAAPGGDTDGERDDDGNGDDDGDEGDNQEYQIHV